MKITWPTRLRVCVATRSGYLYASLLLTTGAAGVGVTGLLIRAHVFQNMGHVHTCTRVNDPIVLVVAMLRSLRVAGSTQQVKGNRSLSFITLTLLQFLAYCPIAQL